MMNIKQKRKLAEKFIMENGAAMFDFKNRTVYFHEGGLFSIDEHPVMPHKVRGTKKLSNGMVEILFTKKKYPSKEIRASVWFEEIRETINYFKRLEKCLIKMGYNTNPPYSKKFCKSLRKSRKSII